MERDSYSEGETQFLEFLLGVLGELNPHGRLSARDDAVKSGYERAVKERKGT
jgi:hypothetical protein